MDKNYRLAWDEGGRREGQNLLLFCLLVFFKLFSSSSCLFWHEDGWMIVRRRGIGTWEYWWLHPVCV